MPKRVNEGHIAKAKKELEDAKAALDRALGMLPSPNTDVSPEPGGGIVDEMNEAKVEIQFALADLGGRPCGGGRPC